MSFRASFCDPFKPDIIEMGRIDKDSIIEKFESIDWADYLKRMQTAKDEKIFYSPSLEIENNETKNALSISAVGDPAQYEFYIFYKRPKNVKMFFGLKKRLVQDYLSDKTGQTKQDSLDCLNALIRNDPDYLENKIGT